MGIGPAHFLKFVSAGSTGGFCWARRATVTELLILGVTVLDGSWVIRQFAAATQPGVTGITT
jgi:hypothetical protein